MCYQATREKILVYFLQCEPNCSKKWQTVEVERGLLSEVGWVDADVRPYEPELYRSIVSSVRYRLE